MANKFQITITALDQASKVVRGVKNSISGVVRPFSQIKRSVGNLGKELGLGKIGKGLGNLAQKGAAAASKLGVLTGPMAALGSATSIAGIAALASEWGRLGVEVANTSANIGISTSQLQSMRGAAALAGAAEGAMDAGLKSLGDTMEDALYGRNQQAMVMMSRLGITMHQTADGAVDTQRAFSDLADAIVRQKNPQVQGLIARQFGVEALLPLLRKGSAGIAEYKQRMAEFGVATDAQNKIAQQFGHSVSEMGLSIGGIGTIIEQRLIPKFQPVIEGLTNWIVKHKEAAANITELGVALTVVGGIATAIAIPFGLMAALVAGVAAAIVAAIVLIYEHWDGIVKFFEKGVAKIKSFFADLKSMLPTGLAQMFGINLTTQDNSQTSAPAAPLPSTVQKQVNAAAAANTSPQKMHVELDVKGMPPGSTARAKTGMGAYLPTRVNYSMPSIAGI